MKIFIPFFCCLFLFLLSCSKDELQMVSTIVDEADMHVTVSEYDDHIIFRVEALQDTTDNRTESGLDSDFCTIAFDINQNGDVDANIDFAFGSPTSNYDICAFYFLENNATTPCGGYESEATFTDDFAGTDLNATPHLIWELDIPKKELGNANAVDFIVKTFQPTRYTTYPRGNITANSGLFSFDTVLTITW